MTSLNGPGFSISLLKLDQADELCKRFRGLPVGILELIDLPTEALAWSGCANGWNARTRDEPNASDTKQLKTTQSTIKKKKVKESHVEAVIRACKSVLEAEDAMTRYDTIVGDGDCGATWAKGAHGVSDHFNQEVLD
jgi:dihydroxyacetone kinase